MIRTSDLLDHRRACYQLSHAASFPTQLLVDLLTQVLKSNLFHFNSKLFLQKIGTAMGTRVAPTLANIFMAVVDELLKECAVKENLDFIHFFKWFIDDILMIWSETEEK